MQPQYNNESMKIVDEKIQNPSLRLVGDEADARGMECYVIGGWVRDLLLGRHSKDIDIVVVGSGIELAEAVAAKLRGAHLSVFKTYGTAQVKIRDIELEFVQPNHHLSTVFIIGLRNANIPLKLPSLFERKISLSSSDAI